MKIENPKRLLKIIANYSAVVWVVSIVGVVIILLAYGLLAYMFGHSRGYQLAFSQGWADLSPTPAPEFSGQQLFDAVNGYRKGKGLVELRLNDNACNDIFSRWQALSDPETFGHEGLDEWAAERYPQPYDGGEIYAEGNSPEDLINDWVNSPSHRIMLEGNFFYGCAYASNHKGVVELARF